MEKIQKACACAMPGENGVGLHRRQAFSYSLKEAFRFCVSAFLYILQRHFKNFGTANYIRLQIIDHGEGSFTDVKIAKPFESVKSECLVDKRSVFVRKPLRNFEWRDADIVM